MLRLVFVFLKKYLKMKAENYPLNGAMMDVWQQKCIFIFFSSFPKGSLFPFSFKKKTNHFRCWRNRNTKLYILFERETLFFVLFLTLIMRSGWLPNRHFDFGTSEMRDALTMSFP